MPEIFTCQRCGHESIMYSKKRDLYICEECNHEFRAEKPTASRLRIFISYGHDQNEELVRIIKSDLEKRGHDVWFDKSGIKESGIKPGDDWRRAITDGIVGSNRVVSFLSKHSTRDPGVCLDEISIAIGVKGGNIQTILVESETEVKAPPSISYIQWLDMHDWKQKKTEGEEIWETWYEGKFAEIVEVIESDESRRFAGEIEILAGYLKPITSDSRISQLLSKGFVGREWVTDSVEEWRTGNDRSSRLFWILGNPGVGKSAIMAHLSHFGKDRVIAAQFCEYDKPDHRNAVRVICSLAFQLATRLPDYRKLLLTLPEISKLETKGDSELFDYLFANPLKQVIKGGRERYLILIDALDEAKEGERNPLVEMLARHAPRLPEWLGIVVTSRPEKNVTDPLQGLNPFILDTDSETNKEDIRQYLKLELREQLDKLHDTGNIVEQILQDSEGVFLYAEKVCTDVREGNLSLHRLSDFPKGLGGIYLHFFQRQFPDPVKYRKNIRPALRSIMAALEPLPVSLLSKLFGWKREVLNDFTRLLGSLFPVLQESEQKVIKHYHKSVFDWITVENTAGAYYVNVEEGHNLLADLGWQQFMRGPESMDPYFIKWLPRHLLKLERWDDLVNLLCNLEYIQEKAAAKLTYHLVEDFNRTLQYLPDNAENVREENERQSRMDRYTHELVLYAEGEIDVLGVPESISLWSEEKINSEIERMKTYPSRLDRLKDFLNFLGQEAGNLHNYAHEFSHFATQQAWNYADSGPVGETAGKASHEIINKLLLRTASTRPLWNPLPLAILTIKGHTSSVSSVAITPNGKRAISGSWDKTCILWDLYSGQEIKTLKGHTDEVSSVDITPDSKRAISGSEDKTCILWDLDSGQVIHTLNGHNSEITSVAITPDAKKAISGSWDKTCILWDLDSGQPLKTLKGHTSFVTSVAITPNGKKAFSGSRDKTCILWDLDSGKVIHTLKKHKHDITSVAITPDGKIAISCSYDKTCILWELDSGQVIQTLKEHISEVVSVGITPDGKRAISSSGDNTCLLWDLSSGKVIKILKGHTEEISSVAITPDSKRIISGSRDKTCILWDLYSGHVIETQKGQIDEVSAVAITPNGKRAIFSFGDKTCRLWDMNSRKAIKTMNGHSSLVTSVAISPDIKRAITGSYDKTCILWDLSSGQPIHTLYGHTSIVTSVTMTPDGKNAFSGSSDRTCIFWDLNTGKVVHTLKGHNDCVNSVAITPDGKNAISGSSDRTCILWDLSSGKVINVMNRHTSWVFAVSITPDGKYAISGSNDKTCILWDLNVGQAIKILNGHIDGVKSVAITPDGKRVFSGSWDNTCILWDLESEEKVGMFVTNSRIITVSLFLCGILLSESSGEISILNIRKELLCPHRSIITLRKIWDFKKHRHLLLSADCPLCGNRFAPPTSVSATIETITKKARLKPGQSPCLELPKEAWEEPGLLGNCPKCGGELKFNPFVVGGEP